MPDVGAKLSSTVPIFHLWVPFVQVTQETHL